MKKLTNDDAFLFAYEDKYATYSLNKYITEVDSPDEIILTSRIYDVNTNEVLFEIQDQVVNYFTNEYIYTSSLKEETMIFRKYDFNSNLVATITPSDSLETDREFSNMVWQTDFDQIIRIIDDSVISFFIKDDNMTYIQCQFDTNHCEIFYAGHQ